MDIIIKMERQKVKELKALAKERGIPRYYRMRKAELIEALGNTPPPGNIVTRTSLKSILDEPIPEIKAELVKRESLDEPKRDPKKCPHGRVKYYCRDCHGSQICPHNHRK